MLNNQVIALFEIPNNSLSVKLFDDSYSKILTKISKLVIDNEEIDDFSENFTFKEKGIHTVYILLNSELGSMKNLFADCYYLKEVDLSNLEN